jgi:tetratricopeptide (TPR) repeat protein
LGDAKKAIEFYEKQLVIVREIGDRRGEGNALGNLGLAYAALGDARKAIEFHEQALVIDCEIGNRSGESSSIENKGLALLSLGEYKQSIEFLSRGIEIADEISRTDVQQEGRWGIAQAYLFQNDLVNAHATIEAALRYDAPEYNHNVSALHGIIALRQGDEVAARGAFVRAIGQADEILSKTAEYYSALDAKGLALCGLAILAGRGDACVALTNDAIETFRKARKIAPHAGIVKATLRLFDELAKCEGGDILKEVRQAVEGKE